MVECNKNIIKRMLENYSSNVRSLKRIEDRLLVIATMLNGDIKSTSLVEVKDKKLYRNNLAALITEECTLIEEKKYYEYELKTVNDFLSSLELKKRRLIYDKYVLNMSNEKLEKKYAYTISALHKRIDSAIFGYYKNG